SVLYRLPRSRTQLLNNSTTILTTLTLLAPISLHPSSLKTQLTPQQWTPMTNQPSPSSTASQWRSSRAPELTHSPSGSLVNFSFPYFLSLSFVISLSSHSLLFSLFFARLLLLASTPTELDEAFNCLFTLLFYFLFSLTAFR